MRSALTAKYMLFGSLLLVLIACGSRSNPIIGKWHDSTGILGVEFTSNEMRIGPSVTRVRYKVSGNEVTVYPTDSSSGIVVTVVNKNEISLVGGLGLPGGNLQRVP